MFLSADQLFFYKDCDAINGLGYGVKKWWLLPPSDGNYSIIHPVEIESEDEADSAFTVLEQNAGDLLFIPAGWSHMTLNKVESIGLAIEFGTNPECLTPQQDEELNIMKSRER